MFSELSDEQLVHKALSTERELVTARFAHSMGQLENTATLKVLRRDIARIKTEARRREADQGLGKDALFNRYRPSFQAEGAAPAEPEAQEEKGGFLKGIVDKLKGSE